MTPAERIVRHYRGDWNKGANQGNIPGDGHSKGDRSVTVKDAPERSNGILVHCHGGGRSSRAIEALKQAGYEGELYNLKGGITAWSDEVDPTVPKY